MHKNLRFKLIAGTIATSLFLISSDSLAVKSTIYPIDWKGSGSLVVYSEEPQLIEGIAGLVSSTWNTLHQTGSCSARKAEWIVYRLYGADQLKKKTEVIKQVSAIAKVRVLGDLPPMSVYRVDYKGSKYTLTFNQIDESLFSVVNCLMK